MNLIVRPSLVTAPLSMPKSGGAADAMLFDIGMGSASMARAKTADTATRKMGVLKEAKFTLFIIDEFQGAIRRRSQCRAVPHLLVVREATQQGQ
jgi:hypothetical protein